MSIHKKTKNCRFHSSLPQPVDPQVILTRSNIVFNFLPPAPVLSLPRIPDLWNWQDGHVTVMMDMYAIFGLEAYAPK